MASNNFLFLFGKTTRAKNVLLRRYGDLLDIFDYGATASPIEPWPLIGTGWDSGSVQGTVNINNTFNFGSVAADHDNSGNTIGARLSWATPVPNIYWSINGFKARQNNISSPKTITADTDHSRGEGNGVVSGKYYLEFMMTNKGGTSLTANLAFMAGVTNSTHYAGHGSNLEDGGSGATQLSTNDFTGDMSNLTVNSTTNGIVGIAVDLDNGQIGASLNGATITMKNISSSDLTDYTSSGAIFFAQWSSGHEFEIRDHNSYSYSAPSSDYTLGWAPTS